MLLTRFNNEARDSVVQICSNDFEPSRQGKGKGIEGCCVVLMRFTVEIMWL